ncbi:MAG: PhzF family phenazine biosynthesis protein [Acidobacteriota bacterium]|nr:MAG: PhzF family phenazine biosynthesis protein [Acidobacteriota bacterium]
MREYQFIQADVFTDRPFTGNPLAIFPEAEGLSSEEMQSIAKEMNLSETTFVLPATDLKAQLRLRIFTPSAELPLAGHPVVGTCFILAQRGIISLQEGTNRIHQECGAGVLPVDITVTDGKVDKVVMTQSPPRFFDEYTDRKLLADAVGLSEDQLLPDDLPAQVVSTAVPQLMVPARSLRHLDRIELDLVSMRKVLATTRSDSFMIFTRECVHDEATVHARMFAPTMGIAEDPATGSASGALGAYLVRRGLVKAEPTAHILVEQGYEMGRPSSIHVEVDTDEQGPVEVRVGGKAVEVADGKLQF